MNHGEPSSWLNIAEVEKKYDAKYVGEFCLKTKTGGWSEDPVSVFYVTNPDTSRGHTNYFGILSRMGTVYICDASSAAAEPFVGLQYGDEIIYSRFRHDFRSTRNGNAFVDGGRDYFRRGGDLANSKEVMLQIIDGEVKVLDV